jgi:undecaprenyl diphosphate synthase
VRITVIGRRDRIPRGAREAIELAEAETLLQSRLHLRIAVDYSSRDMLLSAWNQIGPSLDREAVNEWLGESEVDLLIRTGGEQRLSDFLLWECAYAELLFNSCLWPDFSPDQLQAAIENYHRRERRFGGLENSNAANALRQSGVL